MSPPAARPGLLLTGIAGIAVAACLAIQVSGLHDPFDASLGGMVSAEDYGYSCRAFDSIGFVCLRFQPTKFFVPGTTEGFVPAVSHSFPSYAAYYAAWCGLGRDEAALRSLSLLLLLAGLAGTTILAGMGGGTADAAPTLALLALSPVVITYGTLVDFGTFAFGLVPCAAVAWFRWRRSGSRTAFVAFESLALVAGLTSWYAFALVPALWIDLLLGRPRDARPWRRWFQVGLPFGIALVIHLAWWAWVLDAAALDELFSYLGSILVGQDAFSVTAATGSLPILGFSSRALGIPILACAALGLLATLRELRHDRESFRPRITLALFLTGLVYLVVFWARTFGLEYLLLPLAPGLSLLAMRGLALVTATVRRALPTRAPRAAALVPTVLLLAVLGLNLPGGLRLRDSYRSDVPLRWGRDLEAHFTPHDVLLLPAFDYQRGLMFYTRSPLLPFISRKIDYESALAILRPAATHIDRIFLLARPQTPARVTEFHGPWMLELPIKTETARILTVGDAQLTAVELDRDEALRPDPGSAAPAPAPTPWPRGSAAPARPGSGR